MSALIERILKLAHEIDEFQLRSCSPAKTHQRRTLITAYKTHSLH